MPIPPIHDQASVARAARGQERAGTGRRYALEGDARPGDVLALAGGALVRDRNANGLIDGFDAPLEADGPVGGLAGPIGGLGAQLVDELVGGGHGAPPRRVLVDLRA